MSIFRSPRHIFFNGRFNAVLYHKEFGPRGTALINLVSNSITNLSYSFKIPLSLPLDKWKRVKHSFCLSFFHDELLWIRVGRGKLCFLFLYFPILAILLIATRSYYFKNLAITVSLKFFI